MNLIRQVLFAAVLVATTVGPALSIPSKDVNPVCPLPTPIDEALKYSDSVEYKMLANTAVSNAMEVCRKFQGQRFHAIVLDIDETLLDNREEYRRHPKYDQKLFDAWVEEARAPLIWPVAEFAQWARRHGFTVVLITSRKESQRKATIQNLVDENVSFDMLFMKPDVSDGKTTAERKTAARADVEKMGYQILVNIGDQATDLVGDHSLDCEQMPNKIYCID